MKSIEKTEKELTDLIVQETSLRAKKSNFGNADTDVIRCLYFRLQSLIGKDLPDSSEEMTLFMNQYVTLGIIPLGSGAIFNMQGFLENKNVPDEVKDLINRIFAKPDLKDLTKFLENQNHSKTVH